MISRQLIDLLDPILDACVAVYKEQLDEDGQVDFQGQSQGVRARVRIPRLDPAVHERRVGEALHLPQLPRAEAPRARRRGSVQRYP